MHAILLQNYGYDSAINSVLKIVTEKEDMCHTLLNTICWCERQGSGIGIKIMLHITRIAMVWSYSKSSK